jgi:uncharacterized protein YqgC (DUF456 family)
MDIPEIILTVALVGLCLAGVMLTLLQLPGTWLIGAAAAGYAWYGQWARISVTTVMVLLAIALLAEGVESLTAVWVARRGGASRRAAWYGLIGGIAGALLLSFPVPIIGTLIGAAVGCFVGALIGELQAGTGAVGGARVGMYSAVGRVLGATFKLAASLVMAGVTIVSALTSS